MLHRVDDTIVAISSPPGGAARSIIRVSGPEAVSSVGRLLDEQSRRPLGEARRPSLVEAKLQLGQFSSTVPAFLLVWPAGKSYTGQQLVEIHTIGSRPIAQAILECLCDSGCRMAERGEFTLRAFLAGKMDLVQAEAVLAAVDAKDERSLQVALEQLAGGISTPLHTLREQLLELLAHLEAGLDFADEDLPFITPEQLRRQLDTAIAQLTDLAKQLGARETLGPETTVVLLGWPNVGKSSLFNSLLGRQEAIVSDRPGTTRDYLTAELDLEGLRCRLIDTAGIEPLTANAIAEESTAASHDQSQQADLVLFCIDGTRQLNVWERRCLSQVDPRRIVVITKCDLPCKTDFQGAAVHTSSKTGEGLAVLRQVMRERLLSQQPCGSFVGGTAIRCVRSVHLALESLTRAVALLEPEPAEELIATEVRMALEHIGMVVGAVYTDDILDRIFSRFCIGK